MDKTLIVRFVKEGKKRIYDTIVNEYSTLVDGWSINLLKRVIELNLEKNTGEQVTLQYHALRKAVKKFKKNGGLSKPKLKTDSTPPAKSNFDFKDAHELDEKKSAKPGSFKLK
jgi:hypothetical protein